MTNKSKPYNDEEFETIKWFAEGPELLIKVPDTEYRLKFHRLIATIEKLKNGVKDI